MVDAELCAAGRQQKSRLASAFLLLPCPNYFGAGFLPLDFFFVAMMDSNQVDQKIAAVKSQTKCMRSPRFCGAGECKKM
jgi:hypothetical protein